LPRRTLASVRRFAEILNLAVAFVVLVRLTSLIFGETGVFAPHWKMFGEPLLSPMAPGTASCFLALNIGVMFSRPERGLVALFLAHGPAGTLARWLLPTAIVLPIVFGGLGILAIRAELQGADYPLSLVVVAMIALLLLVISLNTRTVLRVDRERSQRERLLRAVFDNAGAGLALVDAKGRPLVTNTTLQTMLGYSEDELAHLPFTTFSHPDDAMRDKKKLEEILAGEKNAYSLEKRYLRKDGTEFWGQLNVSIARGDQQQPEFLVGMVQDITERREAEETLARFKAVLDATPDFVGMADAKSRAIYVNRADAK
jgi:PAS domain S-box-containing protein